MEEDIQLSPIFQYVPPAYFKDPVRHGSRLAFYGDDIGVPMVYSWDVANVLKEILSTSCTKWRAEIESLIGELNYGK